MGIVALIIIGAAAGLFATRLMRVQAGLIPTVSIGILGALLGGLVLRGLIVMTGWLAGFAGAVLAAMILIWLWLRYGPKG
jgi:uncharacterized membrane protein YeaQ/YmgE (transglycosylase-associated protein family)